jgi:hypothetical protein
MRIIKIVLQMSNYLMVVNLMLTFNPAETIDMLIIWLRKEIAMYSIQLPLDFDAPPARSFEARPLSQAAPHDLGWAAGLVDGEGCIHLARVNRDCGNGTNYRVRLNVAQNCLRTLREFQEVLGGVGHLVSVKRKPDHSRQVYALVLDGPQAIAAILWLLPHLRRKREEALVVAVYSAFAQPDRHPGPRGAPPWVWFIRRQCFELLAQLKRKEKA